MKEEIKSIVEYFKKIDIDVVYDEKEKVLKSKKS